MAIFEVTTQFSESIYLFLEKVCPLLLHLAQGFSWRAFRRVQGEKHQKFGRSVCWNNRFPFGATSWCFNRLASISEGDRFSKSSQSATSKPPDHPLSARNTFPMKILGSIADVGSARSQKTQSQGRFQVMLQHVIATYNNIGKPTTV